MIDNITDTQLWQTIKNNIHDHDKYHKWVYKGFCVISKAVQKTIGYSAQLLSALFEGIALCDSGHAC